MNAELSKKWPVIGKSKDAPVSYTHLGIDPLAKFHLLENDLVLAAQLSLLNLVLQIQRQLSARDPATGELDAVRRQRAHRQVVKSHLDIGQFRRVEDADLAAYLRRTCLLYTSRCV